VEKGRGGLVPRETIVVGQRGAWTREMETAAQDVMIASFPLFFDTDYAHK
jgi:hypothetical protein